jgi:hypothetical protein
MRIGLKDVECTVDIVDRITVGLSGIVRLHSATRRAVTKVSLRRKRAIVRGRSRKKERGLAVIGLFPAIMGLELVGVVLDNR